MTLQNWLEQSQVLIETKANKATDRIFKVIEDETEPQDYDPDNNSNN